MLHQSWQGSSLQGFTPPRPVRRPRWAAAAVLLAVGAAVPGWMLAVHTGTPALGPAEARAETPAARPDPTRSLTAQPATAEAAAAQPGPAPSVAALWVSRPVHVAGPTPDTVTLPAAASQTADTYPLTLVVPERVRLIDGSAFRLGSERYRLTSLEGLGAPAPCEGRRCTAHPRQALREAIAGRTLHCRPADGGRRRETLVTCRADGTTLAALP